MQPAEFRLWKQSDQIKSKKAHVYAPVSDKQARPATETLQIPVAGLIAVFMLHLGVRKNLIQLLHKHIRTHHNL